MREVHIAKVLSVKDPERRGRLRVACSTLIGEDDVPLPHWIEPRLAAGTFNLPNVGDLIEIEIEASDPTDGVFGESSIGSIPVWHGTIVNASPASNFTSNYSRRGFKTQAGHLVIFDDAAREVSISCQTALGPSTITLGNTGNIDISGALSTSIGGPTASSLAKNAQVITAFTALGTALSAIPPGPVLQTDLVIAYNTFLTGLAAIMIGTIHGSMA